MDCWLFFFFWGGGGVYTSSEQDLQHFIENTVSRKRSYTPTLTQTKCGLKVSLGDISFYRINLRIMQTELKMVIVIVDKVSFNEEICTILTVHTEISPSKRQQETFYTLNRQDKYIQLMLTSTPCKHGRPLPYYYKGENLCHDHMLITVNIFSIKRK